MLSFFDDANNTLLVQEIAKNIVKDKRILAVIGHNSSDASIVAAPIYQQGGVVMISPTSTANDLMPTAKNSSEQNFIFRTVNPDSLIIDYLLDYMTNKLHQTFLLCYDSQALYAKLFAKQIFAKPNKLKNLAIGCDLSDANLNANKIIAQAQSQGADSIILVPSVDRISQALKIAQANQQRLQLFGPPTLYTSQTLRSGQKDVDGLILAVFWYLQKGSDFEKEAKQFWGGSVTWRTAMAYDATLVVAEALKLNETRCGLQQILASPDLKVEGVTGEVKFAYWGERDATVSLRALVQVRPSKRSETGYDFILLPFSNE